MKPGIITVSVYFFGRVLAPTYLKLSGIPRIKPEVYPRCILPIYPG